MAAPQKLLIDRLVTAPAIAGGQCRHDREAVMLLPRLRSRRLMTIEAGDAALGMPAHLVFMDDGVLLAGVAFRALARRTNGGRRRLLDLDARAGPIDQEGAHDEAEGDDDRNEDRTERHGNRLIDRAGAH